VPSILSGFSAFYCKYDPECSVTAGQVGTVEHARADCLCRYLCIFVASSTIFIGDYISTCTYNVYIGDSEFGSD